MQYGNVVEGIFLNRPNRFIAHVVVDGKEQTVHVRNTGRCRELLVPNAQVLLEEGSNPRRRTKFSLIAVHKGDLFINMDSQAPNSVVYEGLLQEKITVLPRAVSAKREVRFGQSRFDIGFQTADGKQGYIEVKGVTLEQNGIARFPDAPTVRGTKHVHELINVVHEGGIAMLCFLIQMSPVRYFTTNDAMDPAFSQAVREAANAGVQIIAYDANVSRDSLTFGQQVAVRL